MTTLKERKRLYNSPRWRRVRRLVLERAGYRCEEPGCGILARLEVHHVVRVQDCEERGLSVYATDNLVALCRDHHRDRHLPEVSDPVRRGWAELVGELAAKSHVSGGASDSDGRSAVRPGPPR